MEYYFELKKPDSFRYFVMNGVKECILLQTDQEKLDLIRQAKKDLFKEIAEDVKELEALSKKLEIMLVDDDLKKEIQDEINKEKQDALAFERKQAEEAKLAEEVNASKAAEELVSFVEKKSKSVVKQEVSKPKKEVVKKKVVGDIFSKEESAPSGLESFEYTLDQIEKKLAELKRD